MKKKLSKLSVSIALSLGLVTTSMPARAVCDGCVVSAVGAAATAIIGGMVTAVELWFVQWTAWTMLPEVGLFANIKSAVASLGQVNVETATLMASDQIRRQGVDEKTQVDHRNIVYDPCAVVASTLANKANDTAMIASASVSRGGGSPPISGSPTKKTVTKGSKDQLKELIDIANGKKIETPSPDAQAAAAASAACGNFADGARSTICKKSDDKITTNALNLPNADILAGTLFDGPLSNKAGAKSLKKYTVKVDPNDNDAIAVASFMKNMGIPIELERLSAAELSTNLGKQHMAIRDVFDARMSLALYPMNYHIGMMAPNVDNNSAMYAYIKESPDISADLQARIPDWTSKGVSADELTNVDVNRRYKNAKWVDDVGQMQDQIVIAKEQLKISAQHSVLLWSLIQEVRRNSIIQGEVLASNIRKEMTPELIQTYKAAKR